MAIFWRALDPRSYKHSDVGGQKLRSDPGYDQEHSFSPEHRRIMTVSRKAAADSLLHQSYQGWERGQWEHVREEHDAPTCDWSRRPMGPFGLGARSVEDNLYWVPIRLRSPFSRILHFALALVIERLRLGEIYLQIPVSYLKYWLVKDTRAFLGNQLADCLETWIDEVEIRFEAGEELKQFRSLSPEDREFNTKPEPRWRPTPLTKACSSVYSTRARIVAVGEPFSMQTHATAD